MNFQNLTHVENADFFIDLAFRRAKEKVEESRSKKFSNNLDKSKYLESLRIETVGDTMVEHLEPILNSFPIVDELPEFYQELIRITLDYASLKKSLGAILWAMDKIKFFTSAYVRQIKNAKDLKQINPLRQQYYGRASSVIKQIKTSLDYLEFSRRTMKQFPTVKTSVFTVSIVGFPNVGKTTLLFKLTGSRPEISDYAFTTKSINVSYILDGTKKLVQLLDTPGTLNRPEKMNAIEMQAYLAIKLCSQCMVYVFDLTLSYPIEDQIKLFKAAKDFKLPILIYFSKSDLIPESEIKEFAKKYQNTYWNIKDLNRKLLELQKDFEVNKDEPN